MPGFDQSLVNDVLRHADIVDIISRYIDVKQKGREYVALCPFHDDRNPSMQISKSKQIFKCFVCGTGGNAIKFVELYEHISFFDALRKVAELVGYSDPRLEHKKQVIQKDDKIVNLENCINDLTKYYEYALSTQEGQEPLKYLRDRGIDDKIQKKFLIGYSFKDGANTCKFLQNKGHSLKSIELIGIAGTKDSVYSDVNAGRIIFPICDQNGQVVGFSARKYIEGDDSAKYINSPETDLFHKSNILYNYHNVKMDAKRYGYVYVVEGFMDVIALEKVGISSAVALMGTALTKQHIALLKLLGVEIRFCLDGDEAGQMGHMRIINMIKKNDLNCRFIKKSDLGKDCDEILSNHNEETLKLYLKDLLSPADFIIHYYEVSSKLNKIEDRESLIKHFIPILLNCKSSLEYDDFIKRLAKVTGFPADSINEIVSRVRKSKDENVDRIISTYHPEKKYLRRLNLAEKEILYQMLKEPEAIIYYENNIESFYDSLYRRIADYIIDYYHQNNEISISGLTSSIENSSLENPNELINEIISISFEKNHVSKIDQKYLDSVNKTIKEEKEKIYEKETLNEMLEDKSDKDQARIIRDWISNKLNNKK